MVDFVNIPHDETVLTTTRKGGKIVHMITIPLNSEAGDELRHILNNADTYKVSVDIRNNGVALKRNEGMWTPTLSTKENA